eukprot:15444802-Alexandrium_andersonii.AAC.1
MKLGRRREARAWRATRRESSHASRPRPLRRRARGRRVCPAARRKPPRGDGGRPRARPACVSAAAQPRRSARAKAARQRAWR